MISQLRPPGVDDLTPDDYRDMFEELRAGRSLRALVEDAGAPAGRIAYWSRYERGQYALPDWQGRNELRRLVGLAQLPRDPGELVVENVSPAAAVWQVGPAGPAERVILVSAAGPLTIQLDADAQAVEGASLTAQGVVQGCTRTKRRKAMWRPVLPPEWRSELEKRGLDLREIIQQAIS